MDEYIQKRTYVKRLAVKGEHSGRENVLSTIKHRTGAIEPRLAVDDEHVFKDAPVDDRGHIGRDSNIIVIHIDVGEMRDLEKVCVDLDSLAGGTRLRPLDELCQAKTRHGGVFFSLFFF